MEKIIIYISILNGTQLSIIQKLGLEFSAVEVFSLPSMVFPYKNSTSI